MFGLFKSKTYQDSQLGAFTCKGGKRRGNMTLAGQGEIGLLLAGGGDAPEAKAIEVVGALPQQYAALRPEIQKALFDHYAPYAESGFSDLKVENDETLWKHVRILGVLVEPLSGVMTAEIAIATDWDEEHILGARMQAGKLTELNGSILCEF